MSPGLISQTPEPRVLVGSVNVIVPLITQVAAPTAWAAGTKPTIGIAIAARSTNNRLKAKTLPISGPEMRGGPAGRSNLCGHGEAVPRRRRQAGARRARPGRQGH